MGCRVILKKISAFLKELLFRFGDDEVAGLSAQLAYFFLLSLFPFMIFLVTLIGFLPVTEDDILNLISRYAPGQTLTMIEDNLSYLMNNRNGSLLSIGIIGALWSASNGINAVIIAFNRAYDVGENRSYFKSRLISIFLTVAMIIVISIALLLPVFGKAIGIYVSSFLGLSDRFLALWNAFRWVSSFVILIIVLACLYIMAPNKSVNVKEALIGATFATVGWQLVSLAFSYYVNSIGNFSATYGSLGGVIVLMIWFYLSGMIIILGGEINAMLKKRRLDT